MAVHEHECLWCGNDLNEWQRRFHYLFCTRDCVIEFERDCETAPGENETCALCSKPVSEASMGFCRPCRDRLRVERGWHHADLAMALKRNGMKSSKIAWKFDIHQSTINYLIRKHPGYTIEVKKPNPWSPEYAAAVFAQAIEAQGYPAVARRLGITTNALIGRLAPLGYRLKPFLRKKDNPHGTPAPSKACGRARNRHSRRDLPGPHCTKEAYG